MTAAPEFRTEWEQLWNLPFRHRKSMIMEEQSKFNAERLAPTLPDRGSRGAKAMRNERLKAALRANLLRRKQQARARSAPAVADGRHSASAEAPAERGELGDWGRRDG